jgi:hypothetical protein
MPVQQRRHTIDSRLDLPVTWQEVNAHTTVDRSVRALPHVRSGDRQSIRHHHQNSLSGSARDSDGRRGRRTGRLLYQLQRVLGAQANAQRREH